MRVVAISVLCLGLVGCFRKPPEQRPSHSELVSKIHDAVAECNLDRIESLLGEDFNFNEPHETREPLFMASLRCSPGVSQTLLKAGVDVNAQDALGMTAAMHAVEGYFRVTHLVSKYPESRFPHKQIGFRSQWPATSEFDYGMAAAIRNLGRNSLRQAMRDAVTRRKLAGYERSLKGILKASDLSIVDKNGMDVVAHALSDSGPKTLDILVSLGARFDREYSDQRNAAHFAVRGNADNLKYVVDRGVDATALDGKGRNILYYAVESGSTEVIPFILQAGVDVNRPVDANGLLAIQMAVAKNDFGLISELKRLGADTAVVNAKNEPLLFDFIRGAGKKLDFYHKYFDAEAPQPEAVAYARELQGKPRIKFPRFTRSLFDTKRQQILKAKHEVSRFHEGLREFIKGVDLNRPNDDGLTPLMLLAQTVHSPEATIILLESGAKIDARDKNGDTALFHAVRAMNLSVTDTLLDKGASLRLRNKAKKTVYEGLNYTNSSQTIAGILEWDTMRLLLARGSDHSRRAE